MTERLRVDTLRIDRYLRSIERISHKRYVIGGSSGRHTILVSQKLALTTNNRCAFRGQSRMCGVQRETREFFLVGDNGEPIFYE